MIKVTTIPASKTPNIRVITGDNEAIMSVAFVEMLATKLVGSVGIKRFIF
jgi:hypothetical protein